MTNRIAIAAAGLGFALIATFVGYVVFLAVDASPAAAFRNVSHSMEPALLVGDYFTIREFAAGQPRLVRRGEIISHRWPPDPSKEFVKRLVGLPGDTLEMRDGHLRVNNRDVAEPYAWYQDSTIDPVTNDFRWQRRYVIGPAAHDTARYVASRNNWGPLVVPSRMYFVLGDNRDNSLDGRYWGFLP